MTASDPRLGVVGDELLAADLRSKGLDVVSAPAFDQAATAVSSELRTGHLDAVLVVDSDAAPTGTHLWARTTATKAPMAILRSGTPSAHLPPQDRAAEVTLPVDLGRVLAELGLSVPALVGMVAGAAREPAGAPAAEPLTQPQQAFESGPVLQAPASYSYTDEFDDLPMAAADPSATPAPVHEPTPPPQVEPPAAPVPSVEDLFGSYAQSPMSRRTQEAPASTYADLWSTSSSLSQSPAPLPAAQPAVPESPAPTRPLDDMWSTSSALGAGQQTLHPVEDIAPAAPAPSRPTSREPVSFAGTQQPTAAPVDHEPAPSTPTSLPAIPPPTGSHPSAEEYPVQSAIPLADPQAPADNLDQQSREKQFERSAVSPPQPMAEVRSLPHAPQQVDTPAPVVSRRELRARQAAQVAASRQPSSGGQVLVCMAGKGGVGKSSLALATAQRAASSGPQGFRVTLVDANRGQGDLRTYLHLVNDNLPTIYDAAFTGDFTAAHSLPKDLNAARGKGKGYLGFAFVAAPPAECADPSVVTAEVYREVIEHARTLSDLVVVDTQIAEAYDTSAMFTRLLTPMLASGGWALGISDLSLPGVANLIERLEALVDEGADPERVLVTLNRAVDAREGLLADVTSRFAGLGRYAGCIGSDPVLAREMNLGHPIGDSEMVAPIVDAVLHQVTGLDDFDPAREQRPRSGRRGRKSGGLFSRRRAA